MKKQIFALALLTAVFALAACNADTPYPPANPSTDITNTTDATNTTDNPDETSHHEQDYYEQDNPPANPNTDIIHTTDNPDETSHHEQDYYEQDEWPVNWIVQTLTDANIRVQFATHVRDNWWFPDEVLFDLSQVEQYHEITLIEDGAPFVFTTEIPLHNFNLLVLGLNDDFFADNAPANARLHYVSEIVYTLEVLTPETPLVANWLFLGGAFPINGFSFTDTNGTTRYFSFHGSGYDGAPQPIHVLEL